MAKVFTMSEVLEHMQSGRRSGAFAVLRHWCEGGQRESVFSPRDSFGGLLEINLIFGAQLKSQVFGTPFLSRKA